MQVRKKQEKMPDGYAEKGETRMPSFYFEARERALLGREYDERYRPTGGVHRGLTLNRMRVGDKPGRELWHKAGIAAHPSGFCRESWELDDAEFRPGLHPYYHAGVYYVQEPSASAPAALLDVKPGEYVLDLCAAPGGKSAQLASALQGQGLLVSNEYTPSRTGALKSNLERMGFPNTVLLNESTDRIAAALPGIFDKVLVDAPCSGEGMFRKEPQAEQQHTPALVAQCAALGKQILHDAAQCLKPGGLLCYSTCTFSPEENEVQISAFLDEHPDFTLLDLSERAGFGSAGEPQRCAQSKWDLTRTKRIYPCHGGEGHFMALLQKQPGAALPISPWKLSVEMPAQCRAFLQEMLPQYTEASVASASKLLYLLPEAPIPSGVKKLRILRIGTELGEVVKDRFEPSHAFFMAFGAMCGNAERLELSDVRVQAWLRGEEIETKTAQKGFAAVLCNGYPLGFGKCSGGKCKNRYPKGLRNLK